MEAASSAVARPVAATIARVTGERTNNRFDRATIYTPAVTIVAAWITLPAPRNSSALKKAWVVRWNMAPVKAPMPSPRNIYPS